MSQQQQQSSDRTGLAVLCHAVNIAAPDLRLTHQRLWNLVLLGRVPEATKAAGGRWSVPSQSVPRIARRVVELLTQPKRSAA